MGIKQPNGLVVKYQYAGIKKYDQMIEITIDTLYLNIYIMIK